jgi:hypothetical protein
MNLENTLLPQLKNSKMLKINNKLFLMKELLLYKPKSMPGKLESILTLLISLTLENKSNKLKLSGPREEMILKD